jgi:ferrous iron transport protein A
MSSIHLASSSSEAAPQTEKARRGASSLGERFLQPRCAGPGRVRSLASLAEGTHGVVVDVLTHMEARAGRLLALGVTPGARVKVLQTFPGIVFLCDQTELAVERGVAAVILVREEVRS